MIKLIWSVIVNARKFKVVSPTYTSKVMKLKEALYMAKIIPRAKVIFVK